jgi:hypothetical protein
LPALPALPAFRPCTSSVPRPSVPRPGRTRGPWRIPGTNALAQRPPVSPPTQHRGPLPLPLRYGRCRSRQRGGCHRRVLRRTLWAWVQGREATGTSGGLVCGDKIEKRECWQRQN